MSYLPGGSVPYKGFFLAVVITSTIFVMVAVIPVLGLFGALIVPVPMLYYYSKLGRLHGILVFVISLAITMALSRSLGFQPTFAYFFLLGSVGPVLSEVLRKNYPIEKTVLYAVGTILALGCAILLYLSLISGTVPWSIVWTYISAMVWENIELYSRTGIPVQHIELLKENAGLIARALASVFPASVFVGSTFFIWLNILGGKWLFRKKGMWYPDFGDLSLWKILDKVVWLVVISGILIMIPIAGLRILGLNMLIALLFIYMLQGLAIISFFFQRKNVPVFLRVFGYFLIFAQQFLLVIVVGLGLIDTWTDFRKLDKKSD